MPFLIFVSIFLYNSPVLATPKYLQDLRGQARTLMKKSHCAGCHTPSLTKAPKALSIYNLDLRDWSSTMTDSQLGRLRWAFMDATTEEILEMGGDPKRNTLVPKEIKKIVHYIDQEMLYRKKNPRQRFADIQREKNPQLYELLEMGTN